MSQTKVKSGLIDFTEGIDSFIEFSGGNSTVTGNLTVTGTLVGYTPTASLNISNWDTAYGWGNHASVGYLTSFDITTQTDAKYLRSDQSDTMTGYLTINGGLIVKDLSNNFTFGHDSTSTSILSGGVQQLYIEKGETFEIGPSDALDDVNYYGLLHRFYTKDTVGKSVKMVLNQNGYVGIGTTSPSYKLDVSGAVSASDYFTSDYYRDSRLEALMYYAGSNQIRVGSGVPTDYLLLYAGASPRMTILSNGYIGINNTNPYRTLQVDGHVGVRNGSFFLGDESGSTNDGFQFYKYSNILRIYKDTGSFGGTTDAQGLNLDLFSGSAYSTRISGNGDSYFGAGGLGVNTTSLSNTLHVNGSFRNGTSSIYFTSAADGGGMYIESVGTTTATRTLRLQGINDAGNAYTQFLISHGAGNIRTVINDQEKIKIDGDGLKFNGDTAAANALDDYEEGTWTPVLSAASNPTLTLDATYTGGKYTKIGNTVNFSFEVRWSAKSGGSGEVYIAGLPFNRVAQANPDGDRIIIDSYNNVINGLYLLGSVARNQNVIYLYSVVSNSATVGMTTSDLGTAATNYIRASGTYFTS